MIVSTPPSPPPVTVYQVNSWNILEKLVRPSPYPLMTYITTVLRDVFGCGFLEHFRIFPRAQQ